MRRRYSGGELRGLNFLRAGDHSMARADGQPMRPAHGVLGRMLENRCQGTPV